MAAVARDDGCARHAIILSHLRMFDAQGGDSEDLIDEAIDSCPVNCIHYVAFEDLQTLERERLSREDNMNFNNYASFKKAWTGQDAQVPETKAIYYGSLSQGTRCNNCPGRGCASCPMFGVGRNPVYLKRQKQREERKIKSGQAAREQADRESQNKMDILFRSEGEVDETFSEDSTPAFDGDFNTIFDEVYNVEDVEDDIAKMTPGRVEFVQLLADDLDSDVADGFHVSPPKANL